MSKVFNSVMGVMQTFAMQRHIVSIRDGMMAGIAPSLIGSFFLILRFFPIDAYTKFMDSSPLGNYLLYPVAGTMDMLALFILCGIAYRLADSYKLEPLGAVITAIICNMVINPIKILVDIPERAEQMAVAGVPLSIIGTKGLFVAIIVAILAVEVYRRIVEAKLVIKMPDSVPPAVAKSFMAIIPTLGAIIVVLLIRIFFENTGYGTLSAFIEKTISAPLKTGVSTIWGAVTHQVIFAFLFAFGIHGAVIDSVYSPLWTIINDENRIAFQNGLEVPNMMTQVYLESFAKIGGTGSTMAFVALGIVFAKSTHIKQVSKLSFGPALFHINEPIIFGVPVVLNPVMMIPFITVPGILSAFSYICVELGLVNKPTGVFIPWTMPSFFNAYIVSDGDFRAILLQIVCFAIAVACYYPFFKLIDKDYLAKELAN